MAMKRSALKRRVGLARSRNPLRRSPLRPRSTRAASDFRAERRLKSELISESGGLCQHCHRRPDWRGLELVHKKAKGQGGKTNRQNCEVWCFPCHYGPQAQGGHGSEVHTGRKAVWCEGE